MDLFLSPMAGAADSAMRRLCVEYGADGVTTEMVSAAAVYYKDKKTFALARIGEGEGRAAVQIFGHDPGIMAYALLTLYEKAEIKPASFDINMGCPVKKVVSSGDGSALMRDIPLAARIMEAAVKVSPVPVTVKMRTGWDREHKNCVDLARAAEACGVSAVTVHGRTREDMYAQGTVDPESIARVKAAVGIPVIANGDIVDAKSAGRMLEITHADGLAIGRAALGDPFVFGRIRAGLSGKAYREPDAAQRIECAVRHLRMIVEQKGERVGVCEARKHMAWYTKGMPGSAELRRKLNEASTEAGMIGILLHIEKDLML